MGTQYTAICGWSIKIDENLTDYGNEMLEVEYEDDMCCFLEEQFEDDYETTGNMWSGDCNYWLVLDAPNEDKEGFVQLMEAKYGNLIKEFSPQFIKEICIS